MADYYSESPTLAPSTWDAISFRSQRSITSLTSDDSRIPSPAFLKNNKTLRDLSGTWSMSKSLSIGVPSALQIQGQSVRSPNKHHDLNINKNLRLLLHNPQSNPNITHPVINYSVALSESNLYPNPNPLDISSIRIYPPSHHRTLVSSPTSRTME